MMKNYFLILFFLVIFAGRAFATHERAGEITYRHISGFTYEVTITTFTYSLSPADRDSLEIHWGDQTSTVLARYHKEELGDNIRLNKYKGMHTYAGQGIYILSMIDPNRNQGIVNIPNSVNIPFYIQSKLVISSLGHNNSVQLSNYPIDKACVYKPFVHNPGATDPDGDSIAYRLTVCRGFDGKPIPDFTQPLTSDIFDIDPYTGDLLWDSPILQGQYNVAFIIEEWRNGILIGEVTRDMQIDVDACTNNPPLISAPDDTCILAGDSLVFSVRAWDNDPSDGVVLTAYGAPFELDNAAIADPNPAGSYDTAVIHFAWQPQCLEVRKYPYNTYFKAIDNASPVPLATYHTTHISVIAPAVNIISATPIGTSINLDWTPSVCENAVGYNVYRKAGMSAFVPDDCQTGVPPWTGFELIAQLDGYATLFFNDDNNGEGLVHGIRYCYIVTARFGDGAESIASNIMCAFLKKDMPIITHVSVQNTDENEGAIQIIWAKPTEIDTTQLPGPYQYRLYGKSEDQTDFQLLKTYDELNDTTFVHTGLDTQNKQYTYKIDFYNVEEGNVFKIGTTPEVNSTFLQLSPTNYKITLSWNEDQPWLHDSTHVFRRNNLTGTFDSLASAYSSHFVDSALINGEEYCYYVKTYGHYSLSGIIRPIVNFSQINCDIPVDNEPPCSPDLAIDIDCNSYKNKLEIQYSDSCLEDKMMFYIHYMYVADNDYSEIIDSITDLHYEFVRDPPTIVGCFAVSARDSLYNYTPVSDFQCIGIDSCNTIVFPPLLSPNGDTHNDWFHAFYVNSVTDFDIQIVNRWGSLVYQSKDPYFQWDGTSQDTHMPCSTGTYYYVARVTEHTLSGYVKRIIKGSVSILY